MVYNHSVLDKTINHDILIYYDKMISELAQFTITHRRA